MENIRKSLKEAIAAAYGEDFAPEFSPAPANVAADYSSNAPLKLAKVLHLPPLQIAEELKVHLIKNGFSPAEISVTPPGFLNFISPSEYLSDKISGYAANLAENISSDEYSGQTIICEFSDPNPFKVLHVGHLYTSVVGDAISRLFEASGARVIRANFGGDVGLHVAKTMYILQQKDISDLKIEDIARCYIEGTAAYDEDELAKTKITELNKEIYKINAEDIHGTPLSDLYWHGRELSYAYFKDFYAKIGVKFDKFYPESSVAALGLEKVQEQLSRGVYEKSNGAVVFDGEKFGLHTRVFINQEGVPTYEAKDVGLIFTKWEDYHFDKSVVITGSEQLEYMKVVLKSVEQYAPDLVEKTTHLTHGLVKLPGNIKMSSRKGNFLKAVDVLQVVADALHAEYPEADPAIALAATKYAFLRYKMGGDIIFNPHESVKMTGNSGPYLLYSAVRAKKILSGKGEKVGKTTGAPLSQVSATSAGQSRHSILLNPSERALILKTLQYQDILAEATRELAPHKLANYLYELAQEFSRFYEKCQVAGSAKETERRIYVQAYLNVMTHGLGLLGIDTPEEM